MSMDEWNLNFHNFQFTGGKLSIYIHTEELGKSCIIQIIKYRYVYDNVPDFDFWSISFLSYHIMLSDSLVTE